MHLKKIMSMTVSNMEADMAYLFLFLSLLTLYTQLHNKHFQSKTSFDMVKHGHEILNMY